MTKPFPTTRSERRSTIKVRNVIILNDFGWINGGQSKVAVDTALVLRSRGISVCYIAGTGPLDERLIANGVDCHIVGTHDILHDPNRLRAAALGIWNPAAGAVLKRELEARKPNETVVHVHGWAKALSPSIGPVVTNASAAHVYTLHEYFLACPNGGFFDYQKNEICRRRPLGTDCLTTACDPRGSHHKAWRVAREAVLWSVGKMPSGLREFIYLTPEQREILGPYMPAEGRWHYLPNPAGPRPPARIAAEKNRQLLFVGRLSPEKGALVVARAAAEASVPIAFAGDGEEREAILQVNPDAKMLGWITPEQVRLEMSKSRALLFPSLWYETFGLVVADALRSGLPVLVSENCVAASMVKHGRSGERVVTGDVECWKKAMVGMRSDERARDYSIHAFDDGSEFADNDSWADRLVDIYDATLVRKFASTGRQVTMSS